MFKVVFTDRALACHELLLQDVKPQDRYFHLVALIKRFADTGKLHSPEQLNNEGDGFFAIKSRSPALRAYFWYDSKERGVIVVSHIIVKKQQKLDKQDKDIMVNERSNY